MATELSENTLENVENNPVPVINTKEELIGLIKEWVKLDQQISTLKKEVKTKNIRHKNVSNAILGVMKKHSIDYFDAPGGSLVYKKKTEKKSISKKYLMDQLQSYYKDNPEMANEVVKHLMDNRAERLNEKIIHKVANPK
jgi:oligoribonuclease (3'-5' exoribonuclease)